MHDLNITTQDILMGLMIIGFIVHSIYTTCSLKSLTVAIIDVLAEPVNESGQNESGQPEPNSIGSEYGDTQAGFVVDGDV